MCFCAAQLRCVILIMNKLAANKTKIYITLAIILSFIAGLYLGGNIIYSYHKSRNSIVDPSNQIAYLSSLLVHASNKGNEALIETIAIDLSLAVIKLHLNMFEASNGELEHACKVMKWLQPKTEKLQKYLEHNNAANVIKPEVYLMINNPGKCTK